MNGQEPHGPPNRVVLGDVDLEINSSKVNIKEKTSSGKKLESLPKSLHLAATTRLI